MANVVGVAETKRRFSELMGRVVSKGERFIIQRRGKSVAALVSSEDLERLEQEPSEPKGLLAAVGALSDFDEEEWDEIIRDIYRQREQAHHRPVDLGDVRI